MKKKFLLLLSISLAVILISSLSFNSSFAAKTGTSASKCKGTALCITGKVTKIVDGDTIELKDYRIRLSLTNTPEKNQNGFREANAFTSKLCPVGSTIKVDQDDLQPWDTFGRLLGKVTCSGKVLNAMLLFNDHANILTKYCSTSEFAKESWAKKYGCTTQGSNKITTPIKPQNKCDPSYPNVCIAPYPPDLDCDQIPYTNFRVLQPDQHRFDGDYDGIGCEKSSQSSVPAPPPPPPATPQPTSKNNCDPSYPDVCIPSPPPDLDCGQISYKNFRVLQPDPHRFDGDKDGIGCEK